MTNAVNPLLGLLPQFPPLGKAEINDLVGLLEVSTHSPGLILNEGHRIGMEVIGPQILDFTRLDGHRAMHGLHNPLHALHFFSEVIEHNQAIFRTLHQFPEGFIPVRVIQAAKEALTMYANKHDDFCELMAEAAFDNLFDTSLTDDLFKPVEGFTPTDEERAKMEEAEKTAKALSGLFDLLKRF